MFSSHEGGTYKEKPMFGANPNSEPDSITVGDITTHIRSNLTGQKGAVSAHKKVENKHNAFSISSRGAASSASQSASLEALELADPEDLPELFSSPVPGAALPGLTPEQLSAVKKNLSRAISNPNVVKTYRPGDPRSPEIKMKVQRDLEKKIQQENLAKAKEAQRVGRQVHREQKKISDLRETVAEENCLLTFDDIVDTLNKFHTNNKIQTLNKAAKSSSAHLPARERKKRILTEEEKKDAAEMDKYLIYDNDEAEENDEESSEREPRQRQRQKQKQQKLDYDSDESSESASLASTYQAGEGGFTEVGGVRIANALIKAADETEGRTLEGAPPTNLLCEECETSTATMYSEVDEELLCRRCCDLLYIPTSSGHDHVDVREGRVRPLRGNDKNRLHSAIVITETGAVIPDYEADEDEMAKIRGYSPQKPSSIEAPEINLVNESAAAEINHTTGKFQRGNIVFFNAEDLISESESVKFTGHAAWRDKQILGVVLAVPNVRHGAFGTAHRRISGNEMMYRVKVIRYVTAEYAKFPDALELRGIGGGIPAGGGGVRVLSSSVEGAVGPDGEGKKAMLTEEKQRAWKLDKQIDMLEQEKIEAQKEHGSSEGSDTVDKDEDNFAQWLNLLPVEQPGETIQDPQLKNSVILVGELKMEFPSVGQSSLVINRKQLLHSITKKADNRMCHSDYQKVMIWWWHSVVKVGRAKDYGSTVKIQALIRKWLVRFLLIERTATRDDRLEWVKWWKVHRNFPYERDPEKQKTCYNVSGTNCFLPTLFMTNRWTRLWMFETKRMVNWMQEGVKLRFQKCFKKWLFEVNHHKNSEIQRLKKLATDEEEKHRLELLEGVETTSVDLWHPAEGIVNMKGQLTALPKIFCSYNTNGSLNVEDFPKYNSFQVRQGGPTDTSCWLIPGQLLFGCYPEGKARLKGRQPKHGDVPARILMSNIGTFINLMEEEEENAMSIRVGDNLAKDAQELLRRRFGFLKSQLQSGVKKSHLTVQNANIEVSNVPRYPTNDTRYADTQLKLHEAVAKQGLAIKNFEGAKADLAHFAAEFKYIRFPIPDGCSLTSDDTLVKLCEDIEARLRAGEKIYLFSRLGHGRVGLVGACLLGRIYGCKAEEALFRVQMYHDSKVSVKMSNRAFSSPQTVDQVSQVRRVLSLGQGCYTNLIVKGEDAMVVYNIKRRVGVPKLGKGEIIEIDLDKMDLENIGEERELDDDEMQEAMVDNRHHCSATPGHGVAEIVPDPVFVSDHRIPVTEKSTIRSSRPLTLLEELRENNDVVSFALRQPLIQADGVIETLDKNWTPHSKKVKKEEEEKKAEERRHQKPT